MGLSPDMVTFCMGMAVAEKRTVKKPLLKLVARDRGNVGRPEAGQKAQIKKSERGSYAKP